MPKHAAPVVLLTHPDRHDEYGFLLDNGEKIYVNVPDNQMSAYYNGTPVVLPWTPHRPCREIARDYLDWTVVPGYVVDVTTGSV